MSNINRRQRIHSGRLERFLGADKIASIQSTMRNGGGPGIPWYWQPVFLADVPGDLAISADGDFQGRFPSVLGGFASVMDLVPTFARRVWREMGLQAHQPMAAAGFASISDALSRASQGFVQYPAGAVMKVGPTGVANNSSSLWRAGPQPAAGSAGAAAPGGTAHTKANTGAMPYNNPASGTMHLVGADFSSSVASQTLLLYDRLFSVAKTMNSTATEAVTGVPTRYQSTTETDADYIGGNFGFVEVGGTALAATVHNWTVCTYTDQANAASTLPSVTGVSGAIVDRLDHPTNQWFTPLETGDVGIKAWTQMQCSALVATGAVNFVIGHPLAFMLFPIANMVFPFDWLTNRDQAPRVFDDACLALMQVNAGSTSFTTYGGRIALVNAAP